MLAISRVCLVINYYFPIPLVDNTYVVNNLNIFVEYFESKYYRLIGLDLTLFGYLDIYLYEGSTSSSINKYK